MQATTNTRQGYNLLAPRFELTEYATPPEIIEACRVRVDHLFPVSRERAVGADLACGTGRGCFALAQTCRRVDGFDFSPGMLSIARREAADRPSEAEFNFAEADLAHLKLPSDTYDRIVTFGAWGHIMPQWRQRLLLQVVSALKSGAVFYTITADPVGPLQGAWWRAALFDAAIKLRNRLLGDPFHMYYLLNDTLTVKALLETAGCEVRLEPVPGSPHPLLTLLMAVRSPAASPR